MAGRLRKWSERQVLDAITRAAAAGHDCNRIHHVPRGTSGTNYGYVAMCSCGWTATPRGRKLAAATAALWHAQEVCAVLDERRRLDGVEWSAAPPAPALRNGTEWARQHFPHVDGQGDTPPSQAATP